MERLCNSLSLSLPLPSPLQSIVSIPPMSSLTTQGRSNYMNTVEVCTLMSSHSLTRSLPLSLSLVKFVTFSVSSLRRLTCVQGKRGEGERRRGGGGRKEKKEKKQEREEGKELGEVTTKLGDVECNCLPCLLLSLPSIFFFLSSPPPCLLVSLPPCLSLSLPPHHQAVI